MSRMPTVALLAALAVLLAGCGTDEQRYDPGTLRQLHEIQRRASRRSGPPKRPRRSASSRDLRYQAAAR